MNITLVYIASVSVALSFGAMAKGIDITPTITSSIVNSQTKSDEFPDRNYDTLSIQPKITASYASKGLQGSLTVDHNHLQRSFNDEQVSDNYTNYSYAANVLVIDKIMNVQLSGQQGYRNAQASNYLVADPILGAQSLAKTQNNSAAFTFSLPKPAYLGLDISGTLSNVKTDRQTDSLESLDNTNKSIQARLYQGSEFQRLSWNLSSSYRDTNGSSNNNLTSRIVNADVKVGLISKLSFVLTGTSEDNVRSSSAVNNLSVGDLSYDSYGAGLSWSGSTARVISLTYNQSSRRNDKKEEFVGLDLNWNFTSRTSISANYGRRFFGESGRFSFTHNSRRVRTRVSYDEQLTTFSRLILSTQDAGVFVCPPGETSFSSCYQPTSPNYELQQGEQFFNFFVQVPDISEEVILRKSLNANIGLQQRKLSTNLSIRHSTTDYIESNRDQTINNIGINSSYKAGSRTSYNASVNYAKTTRSTESSEDKTMSATVGATRQIGRNMSSSLNLRYLDRQSSVAARDLTDRRVTVSLSYKF